MKKKLKEKLIGCAIITGCTLTVAYGPAVISSLGNAIKGAPNPNAGNPNDVFTRTGAQVELDRTKIAAAQIALQTQAVDLVNENPACVLSKGIEFDKTLLFKQKNPTNSYVQPVNTTALQQQILTAQQRLTAYSRESGIRRALTDTQRAELRNVAKASVLTDPYDRVAGLGQCYDSGAESKKFYDNLQIARGQDTEDGENPLKTGERSAQWTTDTIGNAAAILYQGTVLLVGGGALLSRAMKD